MAPHLDTGENDGRFPNMNSYVWEQGGVWIADNDGSLNDFFQLGRIK